MQCIPRGTRWRCSGVEQVRGGRGAVKESPAVCSLRYVTRVCLLKLTGGKHSHRILKHITEPKMASGNIFVYLYANICFND